MQILGHIYEEYGLKAHKKGFFNEWRELTSSLDSNNDLPLHESAELAYKQLKLQGSARRK